jgi:serine/threonine-protein kinase
VRVLLEVTAGSEKGRSFELHGADSFLVGRSGRAHLVLDPTADRFISRAHCLIDVRPPRCLVTDLDSTNGTFVNGERVHQADLSDGDEVRIGRTTIRVGIAPESVDGLACIECASCGRDVTGEALGRPGGTAAGIPYTCLACRHQPPAPVAHPLERTVRLQFLCAECGRDLAAYANVDGLAAELPEALYLCPGCTARARQQPIDPSELGEYTLVVEIGRGGMGIVYKAVHRPTRRVCAVKQILPMAARDERARRTFEREITVQSAVRHPHLVRVLASGQHGSSCFFAVEYMAGGDAGRLVDDVFHGPVPPALAGRVVVQALAGLEALHEHGIVHRDLKPGNILLSRIRPVEAVVAKITDYGLAKSFEEAGNSLFDYTRAGESAGSMMFMPPEQLLEYRFVKPAADVYALGVTLYFLLTAVFPVDYPTPAQLLAHRSAGRRVPNPIEVILDEQAVPVLERNPTLPARLAGVVDRAVRKDLSRRLGTAAEFREELAAALAAEGLA